VTARLQCLDRPATKREQQDGERQRDEEQASSHAVCVDCCVLGQCFICGFLFWVECRG
jgi:hypothetical protein